MYHVWEEKNGLALNNFPEKTKDNMSGRTGERRIKHYSSNHKILLVGEGDFSFSKCLANAFGSGANMTATSLDNKGICIVFFCL